MKDSKKYAKDISKLYRYLKQNSGKAKPVSYEDPIEAIVYAVVSERMKASTAKSVAKKLLRHFVDLNDLRVSRCEEIVDIFGVDTADSHKTATSLTGVLNSIFCKFNEVSLSSLEDSGKRQVKKDLESLRYISSFVMSYCFLTAFHGHAIPMTQEMIDYLKVNGLVHEKSSDPDIAGFLERQITVANAYEFYYLLREESEKQSSKTQKVVREKAAILAKKAAAEAAREKKKAEKKALKKKAKKKAAKEAAEKKKAAEKTNSTAATKVTKKKASKKKIVKKKTATKKKQTKKVEKS